MPDYDFRTLSPIDFEALARDLLNAEFGASFVTFAVGPDGGIDLRDTTDNKISIAQCKHRPDAKKGALVASAAEEARRWKTERPDKYYFIVSAPVSPAAEDEIRSALGLLPLTDNSVWHQGTLNAALGRQHQVEENHIKLWLSSAVVLEKIVSASEWQRSEQLIQKVSERVKLYVQTPAYPEAMKILRDEHLVIISGAPGVGKSTLAEMMLLSLWHQGWTVVNIASDIDDAWNKFRSPKEKVVFYYDDFLGQTSAAEMQKNEASGILLLMERVRSSNGKKLLILTSREQILGQVRAGVDDRARRITEDQAKIRLELQKVDRATKAQMLFNHLHFGFTDQASREQLAGDTRYRDVIDHNGFNPRILESVALRQRHHSVDEFYDKLTRALEHPDDIWAGSFHQLSRTASKILMQLSTWPTGPISLDRLRSTVTVGDPRKWISALKVLENTWVRLESSTGSDAKGVVDQISLFDPSRRDFLIDLLIDPVYFDSTLDELTSLLQLNYLLRLSGLLLAGFPPPPTDLQTFLETSFQRRAFEIDDIAHRLATNDIKYALGQESSIELKNEANRRSSSPSRVFYSHNFASRIETLLELSKVCYLIENPTPKSDEYLNEILNDFLQMAKGHAGLNAESLFTLVKNMEIVPDSPCFQNHAVNLVDLALDNIESQDDIEAYFNIPDWFRNESLEDMARGRLEDAFEMELDAIGQQYDPDLMEQWLEEITVLAESNGFILDPYYTHEKIERLREVQQEEDEGFTTMRPSTASSDASDTYLKSLFGRLR